MGPKKISCDENKILKDIEQDVKIKFEQTLRKQITKDVE